jgi:hypothetical protein
MERYDELNAYPEYDELRMRLEEAKEHDCSIVVTDTTGLKFTATRWGSEGVSFEDTTPLTKLQKNISTFPVALNTFFYRCLVNLTHTHAFPGGG